MSTSSIDICALRDELADSAGQTVAKRVLDGGAIWLYSGSVQTYDYNLRRELKRAYARKGIDLTLPQCAALSKATLMDFANGREWLAALAGEGAVFGADDPEDDQLIRAMKRFKPGAIKLLTRDAALLEECEWLFPPKSIWPATQAQRASILSI
jgi:hypothetical protein